MTNLLYISNSDICLGPAAKIITEKRRGDYGIEELYVSSAGLYKAAREPNMGITSEMIGALEGLGYQPTKHKIEIIPPGEGGRLQLKSQNLILCFEEKQVARILKILATAQGPEYKPEGNRLDIYFLSADGKEIGEPYNLIREPEWWHPLAYLIGKRYVKPNDEEGRKNLHIETVKRLEICVDEILKMI